MKAKAKAKAAARAAKSVAKAAGRKRKTSDSLLQHIAGMELSRSKATGTVATSHIKQEPPELVFDNIVDREWGQPSGTSSSSSGACSKEVAREQHTVLQEEDHNNKGDAGDDASVDAAEFDLVALATNPVGIEHTNLIKISTSIESDPCAAEPRPNTPYFENGLAQLQKFMDDGVRRLDSVAQTELATFLSDCGQVANSMGTVCSGTDVSVLVGKAFASMSDARFGTCLAQDFAHTFSCEKAGFKQKFLMRMFGEAGMQCLFGDAKVLADSAVAKGIQGHDLLTNEQVIAGEPCVLVAGFPCQDVSMLNPHSKNNRCVIKQADKRTGTIFNYLMDFVEKVKQQRDAGEHTSLRVVLLENVMGLAVAPPGIDHSTNMPYYSNLDYCMLMARGAGLAMFSFALDPELFGIPVSWLSCKSSVSQALGITMTIFPLHPPLAALVA